MNRFIVFGYHEGKRVSIEQEIKGVAKSIDEANAIILKLKDNDFMPYDKILLYDVDNEQLISEHQPNGFDGWIDINM
ncbi:hypothetical protein PLGE761_00765 [Pluralibacter gergoviae]|uniref:hypothetical protein n=1 Tax=Pluralibacter gergoviae TaxID=61647 RepID=UPI000B30BB8F|nr:hypothetical protein [Pluralibacter gergoviae]SUB72169.1 Uncharacterised protein [Pluralibacter gergoviae]